MGIYYLRTRTRKAHISVIYFVYNLSLSFIFKIIYGASFRAITLEVTLPDSLMIKIKIRSVVSRGSVVHKHGQIYNLVNHAACYFEVIHFIQYYKPK